MLTLRFADLKVPHTTKPYARKNLGKRLSRADSRRRPTPNLPHLVLFPMVLPHIAHPLPRILNFHPLSPPIATGSQVLHLVPIHRLLHPPHTHRRLHPSPRLQTIRRKLHLHTREAKRTSKIGNVRICTTSIISDAVSI